MSVATYMEQMTNALLKEQEAISLKLCTGQSVKDFADYKELVGMYKQISRDIMSLKQALQEANPDEDR